MTKLNKITTGVLSLATLGASAYISNAQNTKTKADSLKLQSPIERAKTLHDVAKRILDKDNGTRLHTVDEKYSQKVSETITASYLGGDSTRYDFTLNQNLFLFNEKVYSFAPLSVQRKTARRFTLSKNERSELLDSAAKRSPYNVGELIYNHSVLIVGEDMAENVRAKMEDWVALTLQKQKDITNFELLLNSHQMAMSYFDVSVADSTQRENLSQSILRGISKVYTTAWADGTGLDKGTLVEDNQKLAENIANYSQNLVGGIKQAQVFLDIRQSKEFLSQNLETVLMGIQEQRRCIRDTTTTGGQKGPEETQVISTPPAVDYFRGMDITDEEKIVILDSLSSDLNKLKDLLSSAQSESELKTAKEMISEFLYKTAMNRNYKHRSTDEYKLAKATTEAIFFGRLVIAHSSVAIEIDHYTKTFVDPSPAMILNDGRYVQALYLEDHFKIKNGSAGFDLDTLKKIAINRSLDANQGNNDIVDVYYDEISRHLVVTSMITTTVDPNSFEDSRAMIYTFDNLLGSDHNPRLAAYLYGQEPKRIIVADTATTQFVEETKDTVKIIEKKIQRSEPSTKGYTPLDPRLNLPPRYFVNLNQMQNPIPEQLTNNQNILFSDPATAVTRLQNGDIRGGLDLVQDSAYFNSLMTDSLNGEYVLNSRIYQPRVILNTGAEIGDLNVNLLYAVYVTERSALVPTGHTRQWNNSADPRDTDEFGVLGLNLGYGFDLGWFDRYKVQGGVQHYDSEDHGSKTDFNVGLYGIGSAPVRGFAEYYNGVVSAGFDGGLDNARMFANGVNLTQQHGMPIMVQGGAMLDIANITAEIFGSDAVSRQYVSTPLSISGFFNQNSTDPNTIPILGKAEIIVAVPLSQKTALTFGFSYEKLFNTQNNADPEPFYNMGSTRMDGSIYPGVGDRMNLNIGLRLE